MFTVYILFSQTIQKYYTGQTQNLKNRIAEHNAGETKSIKNGIPWEVFFTKEVQTRKEAVALEKKIKRRGAKRFIEDNGSSAR
jgi:putative endonuclease